MVGNPALLKERLGLEVLVQMYGSTETGSLLFTESPPPDSATCGRPRPGAEVRVVDPHDVEVPHGFVGEFVARTEEPWEIAPSYAGRPDATARAWRNGWYHTGDAGWRDEAGNFYYVDRREHLLPPEDAKVPSAHAERALLAHPAVREVAYVRAPHPHDSSVKAYVVLEVGARATPEELIAFLRSGSELPILPRFVELVDAFPKTASTRIKKFELRERPNGPSSWDADAGAYCC